MSVRYPNPENVIRQTTMPPRFPCRLTTQVTSRMYPVHDHTAWVNADGDGTTAVTASHYHRIVGGRVLPDQSDGHTHNLTSLPCGAG